MVILVHTIVGWENIIHDYCDLNSLGEVLEGELVHGRPSNQSYW